MLAPAGKLTSPPVPVMMRLAAPELPLLLLMVAAWDAALTMVRRHPSRPLAIPVIVWADAPVKRISEALDKAASLVVPVVLKSVPFLVATEAVKSLLPAVTAKPPPKDVRPVPTVRVLLPVTL